MIGGGTLGARRGPVRRLRSRWIAVARRSRTVVPFVCLATAASPPWKIGGHAPLPCSDTICPGSIRVDLRPRASAGHSAPLPVAGPARLLRGRLPRRLRRRRLSTVLFFPQRVQLPVLLGGTPPCTAATTGSGSGRRPLRAGETVDQFIGHRPRDRKRHLIILGLAVDPVAVARQDHLRHPGLHRLRSRHPRSPTGPRIRSAAAPPRRCRAPRRRRGA